MLIADNRSNNLIAKAHSEKVIDNTFFIFFYLCIFLSRDDNNPRRVNQFRSTAWTGQTSTTNTTLNTEQNQLAIKVSADN